MTTLQLLRKARKLITSPEHWTKGCLARSAANRPCSPAGDKAVRWCAIGALKAVAPTDLALQDTAARLLSGCAPQYITATNDYHGHGAVLKAYDCAIAKAKEIA